MAQQHINLGTAPAGSDGDTNRTAHQKWENNFNELYAGVPGVIVGLLMERVSGNSLRVTSGSAHVPSLGAALQLPAAVTKSGLTLSASTWYHVYLFAGTPSADIEISTTAPTAAYFGTARAKTGDTSRRYLGSFVTDGGGNIRNFIHTNGAVRYIDYAQSTPFRVLASGVATTATSVSCSAIVPMTAVGVMVNTTNSESATGVFAQINYPGGGIQQFFGRNAIVTAHVAVNSSQQFTYNLTGTSTGGAFFCDVMGYTFER